jgi:hypothetical protein
MLERSQNLVLLRACSTISAPLDGSPGGSSGAAAAERARSCRPRPEHEAWAGSGACRAAGDNALSSDDTLFSDRISHCRSTELDCLLICIRSLGVPYCAAYEMACWISKIKNERSKNSRLCRTTLREANPGEMRVRTSLAACKGLR